MRFRPCIDLYKGKVKQIVGSSLSDEDGSVPVINFETDRPAAEFAQMYRDDGLEGGHVIMLGPGNEEAAKGALASFPGGLRIGGGITPDNAAEYISAGASHVIVTSYVFRDGCVDWERLDEMRRAAGRQHLVVDLSCKRRGGFYFVVTERWQKFSSVALTEENLARLAVYCDEFLVHAADIEGKQAGIDSELVALLANDVPIPVTYAGGIRSIADLRMVRAQGGGRVDATVGSALDIFGGPLRYADVVAWNRTQQEKAE